MRTRQLTIYIPADLEPRLKMLPARSVSKICQEALRKAVTAIEQAYDTAIREAFEED
jgi:hypothetical protein